MIKSNIIRSEQYFIIVYILLLLLNPIIATIIVLLKSLTEKKCNYSIVIISLTILIWCLESTRSFSTTEPMDWAGNYYVNFTDYQNYSLSQYLFSTGKEIVWQIVNIFGYYLFCGDFLHFAFFIVAVTYFFIYLSITKFCQSINASSKSIISALIFMTFLGEHFEIINNLLRQQFAFSIMLYALITFLTTSRINWILIICAFFTHTMSGVLIPFFFIKINKKPSRKTILLIVGSIVFLLLLIRFLPYLMQSGIYLFSKLGTSSEYTGIDIMETTSIYPFLLIMTILYYKKVYIDKQPHPNTIFINNFMLLLIISCILLEAVPLIQVRFYIERLIILPFIIPFLFKKDGVIKSFYLTMIIFVFTFRFFTSSHNFHDFTSFDFLTNTLLDFNIL